MNTQNLDFWQAQWGEHIQVADASRIALEEPFLRLTNMVLEAFTQGHKILFFGNGGSAADAQHLATEFTVRYIKNRPALAALALTTDTSCLTAIGNDLGFDELFSRQIEAFGKPGDVAIGISTSGTSPNVIKGLEMARQKGLHTVAFGGKDGGKLRDFADITLIVPSMTTSRIQEMHITLGQMLCGAVEQGLGYS